MDTAWNLATDLVRIDSSDPGAYEGRQVEQHIKSLVEARIAKMPAKLAAAVGVEELEALPDRRNLMVTVPGTSDEPRLVYICHMDTVTLGEGWSEGISPLGAQVIGDDLYGRGSCDMKGGLSCALSALFSLLGRVAVEKRLPGAGSASSARWTRRTSCAAWRRPSEPVGWAPTSGCWTPSPPTGRSRWPTRVAPGSRSP